MYLLNKFDRPILITPFEVVKKAIHTHTFDTHIIANTIEIVEESAVVNVIGKTFYEYLIVQKNKTVTEENRVELQAKMTQVFSDESKPLPVPQLKVGDIVNAMEFLTDPMQKLWTRCLWKFTAEAVIMRAFPEGYVQYGSSGVHLKQPTSVVGGAGVTSPDLKSVQWSMDKKMMLRVDPMAEVVENFICEENRAHVLAGFEKPYPFFIKRCACDSQPDSGNAGRRKTNVITNLYDRRPGPCCEGPNPF